MKIALLGPTASGKSALAVALAQRLGAWIVNGDPFQAYRGLAIGTGQPDEREQGGVPHLGYGELDLDTVLDPASFGDRVRGWLAQAPRAILVTGSGLYLRGIWEQLGPPVEVPGALTERVRAWQARLGPEVLHRFLRAVDPARASVLHPRDGARIQRALALHLATGDRPSDLLEPQRRGIPVGWKALVVLPVREAQRERVDRRVRAMVAAGWPAEVERIRQGGLEAALRRLRPLGYEAWLDSRDPETTISGIIRSTQAYAKRQVTFFRNQWPEVAAWDPDQETVEQALERLSGPAAGPEGPAQRQGPDSRGPGRA